MALLSGGLVPPAKRGTVFPGVVHVSDIYPTLCSLVGADPTDSPSSDDPEHWFWPVDGMDVWQFVTAGGANPRVGKPLVLSSPYTSGPGGGAMRVDQWKLVNNAKSAPWSQRDYTRSNGNQTCKDGKPAGTRGCLVCTVERPCLYDVVADPSERNDLAASRPDVLHRMNTTYAALVFEMRHPDRLNFTAANGWVCDGGTPTAAAPACSRPPSSACWRTHGHTIAALKNVTGAAACCAACSTAAGCATWMLRDAACWLLDAGAVRAAAPAAGCTSSATAAPSQCGGGHWGCFIGPTCRCPKGDCRTSS